MKRFFAAETQRLKDSKKRIISLATLSLCALAAGFWGLRAQEEQPRNETKFTMGRIYYTVQSMRFMGPIGDGRFGPPWAHDWPRSEEHFMKIMAEVTKLDVNPGGHIMSFETEDCFKYPIAYLCEVGYLNLSEKEARNMAEYLLRGGFLIVFQILDPAELNFDFTDNAQFIDLETRAEMHVIPDFIRQEYRRILKDHIA